MSVLSAQNLKMEFGQNTVFQNVTFDVYEKDKIGLIGVNGAGKTTLFKVITKEYEPTEGTLIIGKNTVVGYMEQHACHNSERSVYDEIATVFSRLALLEEQIECTTKSIDKGEEDIDGLIERQLSLQEEFRSNGGLTYKSRLRATLIGLGFKESEFDMPVSLLSGGQKSKLSLGKLLLSGANLLLLDEPTNHLDIKSVEWLENWIADFDGSVIVISHDRYFLDKVTNKTMEMERNRLTVTKGNYTRFMELKAERQMNVERTYNKAMDEVHRIEGIIAQQKHFGQERNYITIAHKQKSIDRLLDGLEEPEKELESLKFKFTSDAVSGNEVISAQGIGKGFDGKELFKSVDFLIKRNERVFLLGDNGCGKTTLLKILIGQYRQDEGEYKFGANVKVGYFDQTLSQLNESKTVLDEVWDSYLSMAESKVRAALGAFLFKGDDVFKLVSTLSGGEKARVALLKLMLSGANLLLLDEPTNHLDIKSREALENALLGYDGTMLVVSHDRYLINKLATRIFRMTDCGIKTFNGNYDYYLEHFVEKQEVKEKAEKPKVNDYKLRKQKESELRKLKSAIARCENEINSLDEEIAQTEKKLEKPENMADYEKIAEITTALDELHNKQNKLMSEWEEMQIKLENENE